MNHPPNVMLVGLGAVGTVYADRLRGVLPESFSVLADNDRKSRYESSGIFLNGQPCPFVYVTPEIDCKPADLILVSVKQHQLDEAMEEMYPFVSDDTVILSLLNGISSESILSEHFPNSIVLNGFCVGTDALRSGNNVTCANIGRIVFGEKNQGVPSETVVSISKLFDEALIPSVVPEDIIREQWWKFMMNVGLNQVSAITGATYGVIVENKLIKNLMTMACREVAELAPFEDVSLSASEIDGFFTLLSTLSPIGKSSMLQDVEAGRKTEVELFSGTVSALGLKHGVPTPVNDALFTLITLIEDR